MTRVSALLGTLVIVFLCGLPPAHAFECPQPAMPSPGVLQETAQEQQALTQMSPAAISKTRSASP